MTRRTTAEDIRLFSYIIKSSAYLQVVKVFRGLAVRVSSRRFKVIEMITETTEETGHGYHETRTCERHYHTHNIIHPFMDSRV